jgi:hypothetical protein
MWKVQFGFISLQRVKSLTDSHIFGPMKEALRGRRFSSDEEVIGAVQNWLKMKQRNFFSDGMKTKNKKKIVKRWDPCC